MSIKLVEMANSVLDIHRDLSIQERERKPGPPERIDGMTVGVVFMKVGDISPHNGEMHPDGDEILLVASGKIRVSYDSGTEPIDVGAGQACIVMKGEWHKIDCLQDSQFVHITPGPIGNARFS